MALISSLEPQFASLSAIDSPVINLLLSNLLSDFGNCHYREPQLRPNVASFHYTVACFIQLNLLVRQFKELTEDEGVIEFITDIGQCMIAGNSLAETCPQDIDVIRQKIKTIPYAFRHIEPTPLVELDRIIHLAHRKPYDTAEIYPGLRSQHLSEPTLILEELPGQFRTLTRATRTYPMANTSPASHGLANVEVDDPRDQAGPADSGGTGHQEAGTRSSSIFNCLPRRNTRISPSSSVSSLPDHDDTQSIGEDVPQQK